MIVADQLWGKAPLFPVEPIHPWMDEQHRDGIWVRLVREASLDSEPVRLSEFGIYGSRAVGIQRLEAERALDWFDNRTLTADGS